MRNPALLEKDRVVLLVILPLIAGLFIYWGNRYFLNFGVVRNFLPDGLWAFSLISSFCILWNNKIPKLWILGIFGACLSFEILQFYQVIGGIADPWDLFTYFLFGTSSLLINKKTFNNEN